MKVSIIGLGYVGLPLAVLATYKHIDVYGVDTNLKKLEEIRNKSVILDDCSTAKLFDKVQLQVNNKLTSSDIYIVCVPTPVDDQHHPDLTPVINATRHISEVLADDQLVIIESTIYPGLCEEIVMPILNQTGKKYLLAHCPERIDPGSSKWGVANIPRVVGGVTPEATDRAYDFYTKVLDTNVKKLSSIRNAEATKILENIFRDVNIALVNEMAQSFYRMNIDVKEVIDSAATKPFAFMPHYPGVGVGGHCIAVDPYYMIEKGHAAGFDHELLRLARKINNNMPIYTVYLLQNTFNSLELPLKNRPIGVYGVSYKQNLADIRESPSFEVINRLKKLKGANVIVYDPYVPELSTVKSFEEFLAVCEGIVICTAHNQIVHADYDIFKRTNLKVIIDGRNCLDKEKIKSLGIVYKGIGRE